MTQEDAIGDGSDLGKAIDNGPREAESSAARGSVNAPPARHDAVGFDLPGDWITLGPPTPRPDPRPGPRASQEPGIGGRLKERPEDFIVEELPLYMPSGEGEHLYLGVQKTNMPHTEMLAVLCRHFKVAESAIGCAGMKDRVAITLQTVSVHLPVDRPVGELRHERLSIVWAMRHSNKLRRGHLQGNRFSIRVRGVDPLSVRTVKRRMEALAAEGVPDYFGEQRFGYRVNNHLLGLWSAQGEWQRVLDELLGAHGTPFPPHQLARREAYERGAFAEAADLWGRHDQAERIALRALARGRTAEAAVRAVPHHMKDFWISALQGAVFNATLAERVASRTHGEILPGDVAMFSTKSSIFAVPDDALDPAVADVRARCAALELSATGPLFGPNIVEARGEPAAVEGRALALHGAERAMFAPPTLGADGARRPLRILVRDWAVDSGVDEHGGYIRLQFDLQKGAFATVVCSEIM